MAGSMFKKAVKGLKPLRLVIGGASGSGKSFTALEFASYLASLSGKRTVALDTEHGRLSLYADKFDFDVVEVDPPFHPNRIIEVIKEAEKAGYGQLIVDSTTHFWNGSGGLLELVNDIAKTQFSGNSYMAWSKATPIQNAVVDAILRSNMHIIVTTRAKQEYAETEVGNKKRYEKLGMGMVQREGFEYDFDFSIMMDMDNNGLVTKGMANVPPQTYFKNPARDAIVEIMKAITDNSVAVVDVKELKDKVKEMLSIASESMKAQYKTLFAQEGKNPNKITSPEDMQALIDEMKSLKEIE
jgi:hypothetical protein